MANTILQLRAESPSGGTTLGATETTLTWYAQGDTAKTYLNLEPKHIQVLRLRIENTGSANDTATLKVYGKLHRLDDTWVPIVSSWPSNDPHVLDAKVFDSSDAYVDDDLDTLADGDYARLALWVGGWSQIKITSTVAQGETAALTAYAIGHTSDPPHTVIAPSFINSGRTGVTTASQTLDSGAASRHWRLKLDGGSAAIGVKFSTAGTAAVFDTDYQMEDTDAEEFHFDVPMKCTFDGEAATGDLNWMHWN